MKPFDLIVWDWDGTIADSTGLITRALITAAALADLPAISAEQARSIIGLGLRESIHRLFGDITQAQAQVFTGHYQRLYLAQENDIALFDGVADTILQLHQLGLKQAVATGKGRRGLNQALALSGLQDCFAATRTVDECFSKPHPQMLHDLLDQFSILPARCVMIGDSQYDIQMGQHAGVVTVAVSYGSQTAAQLAAIQPHYLFDHVPSLRDWLLEQVT